MSLLNPSSKRAADSNTADSMQASKRPRKAGGERQKNLPWKANNYALLHALMTEVEKEENWVVFGGKDGEKDGEEESSSISTGRHVRSFVPVLCILSLNTVLELQKTTKDSKIIVWRRIAVSVVPERCMTKDAETKTAKAFWKKWDEYVTTILFGLCTYILMNRIHGHYKDSIAEIQGTGSGILTDSGDPFYMPKAGPDDATPMQARNIWGMLPIANFLLLLLNILPELKLSENPVFDRLHLLLGKKPRSVPPALTTGVSPHGIEIQHLQQPSQTDLELEATYVNQDSQFDNDLNELPAPYGLESVPSTPSPTHTNKENTSPFPSPSCRSTAPRRLADVLKKYRKADGPSPTKSKGPVASFENGLLEMAS
jgi:hypothetical protein